MSLFHMRCRCKNCSSEINVQGGVVGTTNMGPSDDQIICPNPSCHATGHNSFEFMRMCDFTNNEEDRQFLIKNDHMDNT